MPVTCAVAGCSNTYQRGKATGASFHLFPKQENTRQQWIEFCGRDRSFNARTWRICSLHFDETDYEKDLQAELLNYIPRGRKLKLGAVPFSVQKQEYNLEANATLAPQESMEEETSKLIYYQEDNSIIAVLKNTIEKLEKDILEKDQKIRMMRKRIHILKVINRKKSVNVSTSCKCSNVLSKIFTPTQILKIKGSKKIIWTPQDITQALTLRYLSKRSYIYLRDSLKYPLPG